MPGKPNLASGCFISDLFGLAAVPQQSTASSMYRSKLLDRPCLFEEHKEHSDTISCLAISYCTKSWNLPDTKYRMRPGTECLCNTPASAFYRIFFCGLSPQRNLQTSVQLLPLPKLMWHSIRHSRPALQTLLLPPTTVGNALEQTGSILHAMNCPCFKKIMHAAVVKDCAHGSSTKRAALLTFLKKTIIHFTIFCKGNTTQLCPRLSSSVTEMRLLGTPKTPFVICSVQHGWFLGITPYHR